MSHAQVAELHQNNIGVSALFIPPSNRDSWEQLTVATLELLCKAKAASNGLPLILLAESFGTCLALRAAAAADSNLISHMVIVNSATGFTEALFGIPSLFASTRLAFLFPRDVYNVAQV
jgi:alpha-beta hydrolase superfamily lysophospholipase